jgi:hypothetical protein
LQDQQHPVVTTLGNNISLNSAGNMRNNQGRKLLRGSKSSSQINNSKNSSLYNLQLYKPHQNQVKDLDQNRREATPDIEDISDDEEYMKI